MRRWLSANYLRSVPGQLALLGVVFAGAIVLGVATVGVRGWLFEPFIREQFAADTQAEGLAKDMSAGRLDSETLTRIIDEEAKELAKREAKARPAAGRNAAELENFRRAVQERITTGMYGQWLMADEGAEIRLLLGLLAFDAETTSGHLKRTFLVGNVHQKQRALEGVHLIAASQPASARDLAEFALERARRRGETELVRRAEKIITNLEP